ncbi:MAG TPA: PAS domain S-box protein [Gammaproteobacteria bacterium]|nr:PAS domain S-box protein [Gammaproteobacteria bacterium]
MKNRATPTGREVRLQDDEFIVSRTDTRGRITYTNRSFMQISGYSEPELLHKQHNIIRHPDMPRALFHFLWETIQQGQECFAYVKNLCKNGDHYWVFANVTADRDEGGNITGYFSVRRPVRHEVIPGFEELYRRMCAAERAAGAKEAIAAGTRVLQDEVRAKGFPDYAKFVLGA